MFILPLYSSCRSFLKYICCSSRVSIIWISSKFLAVLKTAQADPHTLYIKPSKGGVGEYKGIHTREVIVERYKPILILIIDVVCNVALLRVSYHHFKTTHLPCPHKYVIKIPTDWIPYSAPDSKELQDNNSSSCTLAPALTS